MVQVSTSSRASPGRGCPVRSWAPGWGTVDHTGKPLSTSPSLTLPASYIDKCISKLSKPSRIKYHGTTPIKLSKWLAKSPTTHRSYSLRLTMEEGGKVSNLLWCMSGRAGRWWGGTRCPLATLSPSSPPPTSPGWRRSTSSGSGTPTRALCPPSPCSLCNFIQEWSVHCILLFRLINVNCSMIVQVCVNKEYTMSLCVR